MTLDLTPDQPADEATILAADMPTMATLVTLITTDAVAVRVSKRPDGALIIQPGSRNPLILDRFQAGAMRAALAEG